MIEPLRTNCIFAVGRVDHVGLTRPTGSADHMEGEREIRVDGDRSLVLAIRGAEVATAIQLLAPEERFQRRERRRAQRRASHGGNGLPNADVTEQVYREGVGKTIDVLDVFSRLALGENLRRSHVDKRRRTTYRVATGGQQTAED